MKPSLKLNTLAVVFFCAILPSNLSAQKSTLRDALQEKAGSYPLREVLVFASDSAMLVFEDSSLTNESLDNETWQFGPPPKPEELEGCPAEKVLGRKLARLYWRLSGKELGITRITVRVVSAKRHDTFSRVDMYYYEQDLTRPWVGDPLPTKRSERNQ